MKGITGKIQIKLLDKSEKVISTRDITCHTFNKNFAELVWIALFLRGDITSTAKTMRTGGLTATIGAPHVNLGVMQVSESPTRKLQCRIGTNTTAMDRLDYDVIEYLDNMTYSQFTINDDGSQLTLTMSFSWLNTTGSSQDITEASLAAVYYDYSVQAIYWWVISRDVFSAVTVPNGYTLAIGYVITFPW